MDGPTGRHRVLQIHPTRRCNLRCRHCYSSSGPEVRDTLPPHVLEAVIADAAAERYTVLSLSGGEPVLYPHLREMLTCAHAHGLRTAVVTNGTLLDDRHLALLSGATDLLAISVDGLPASHAIMRGSERAFDAMRDGLPAVRAAGIPFGFIFTLTQHNLHELDWIVAFAEAEGAGMVQVHPLEYVGRAADEMSGARPDSREATWAAIHVARLQRIVGDRLRIYLDLVSRQTLSADPASVYADTNEETDATRLGDVLSPLVLETDGTLVPLRYGMSRAYALGNVREHPLRVLAADWRTNGYPRFREHCRQVFHTITAAHPLPMVNWYDEIASAPRSANL